MTDNHSEVGRSGRLGRGNLDDHEWRTAAYPALKASEVFVQLQRAVSEVEDNLLACRRLYNLNVPAFNQLLVSCPASLVGRRRGHAPKDFFEAEERKKEDVKLEF